MYIIAYACHSGEGALTKKERREIKTFTIQKVHKMWCMMIGPCTAHSD